MRPGTKLQAVVLVGTPLGKPPVAHRSVVLSADQTKVKAASLTRALAFSKTRLTLTVIAAAENLSRLRPGKSRGPAEGTTLRREAALQSRSATYRPIVCTQNMVRIEYTPTQGNEQRWTRAQEGKDGARKDLELLPVERLVLVEIEQGKEVVELLQVVASRAVGEEIVEEVPVFHLVVFEGVARELGECQRELQLFPDGFRRVGGV
eukprot:3121292-Rhodomonas_salina.1